MRRNPRAECGPPYFQAVEEEPEKWGNVRVHLCVNLSVSHTGGILRGMLRITIPAVPETMSVCGWLGRDFVVYDYRGGGGAGGRAGGGGAHGGWGVHDTRTGKRLLRIQKPDNGGKPCFWKFKKGVKWGVFCCKKGGSCTRIVLLPVTDHYDNDTRVGVVGVPEGKELLWLDMLEELEDEAVAMVRKPRGKRREVWCIDLRETYNTGQFVIKSTFRLNVSKREREWPKVMLTCDGKMTIATGKWSGWAWVYTFKTLGPRCRYVCASPEGEPHKVDSWHMAQYDVDDDNAIAVFSFRNLRLNDPYMDALRVFDIKRDCQCKFESGFVALWEARHIDLCDAVTVNCVGMLHIASHLKTWLGCQTGPSYIHPERLINAVGISTYLHVHAVPGIHLPFYVLHITFDSFVATEDDTSRTDAHTVTIIMKPQCPLPVGCFMEATHYGLPGSITSFFTEEPMSSTAHSEETTRPEECHCTKLGVSALQGLSAVAQFLAFATSLHPRCGRNSIVGATLTRGPGGQHVMMHIWRLCLSSVRIVRAAVARASDFAVLEQNSVSRSGGNYGTPLQWSDLDDCLVTFGVSMLLGGVVLLNNSGDFVSAVAHSHMNCEWAALGRGVITRQVESDGRPSNLVQCLVPRIPPVIYRMNGRRDIGGLCADVVGVFEGLRGLVIQGSNAKWFVLFNNMNLHIANLEFTGSEPNSCFSVVVGFPLTPHMVIDGILLNQREPDKAVIKMHIVDRILDAKRRLLVVDVATTWSTKHLSVVSTTNFSVISNIDTILLLKRHDGQNVFILLVDSTTILQVEESTGAMNQLACHDSNVSISQLNASMFCVDCSQGRPKCEVWDCGTPPAQVVLRVDTPYDCCNVVAVPYTGLLLQVLVVTKQIKVVAVEETPPFHCVNILTVKFSQAAPKRILHLAV
ncbi:hypothetical protein Pelo_4993 [Pelomyxa schiedti]|nr:hypothetical protein Pelo_4993 [Pelomyxa schiedti]